MSHHKQVTTCLRNGGPVSKFCPCTDCTLSVCAVCGAYEGALTTDCPGERVDFDRQQEVYTTNLDYTKARGWHQGEPMKRRTPRFEDAREATDLDRTLNLQHELAQKAIAWVLADRICDDHAATLTRIEDEVDAHLHRKYPWEEQEPSDNRALLGKLEYAKISFQLADQRAQKRDQEFREAAKKLVDALEQQTVTPSSSKGTSP